MKVAVQIGVSKDCKKRQLDLDSHATVGDLRRMVSEAENSNSSQVTVIINGRRLNHDEEMLSALLFDNPQVIAIIRKRQNVISGAKRDPYEVIFWRKPFGIRIRSNSKLRDAFISNYESDFGRNSGVYLGSKITHINDQKVIGWKTVDIEEQIRNTEIPIRLTLLPRNAISQEELWDFGISLSSRSSERLSRPKHPSDYVVKVEKKEVGLTVFPGYGGRGGYIVAFLSDYGPKIGIKAGSMIVAINGVSCGDWLCSNIKKLLSEEQLPVFLTLRTPEGLTSNEYPILQSDQNEASRSYEFSDMSQSEINLDNKEDPVKPAPKLHSDQHEAGMYSFVILERPLGFGIMSPLGTGVMMSSLQDPELKKKGIVSDTPIISVGGVNVHHCSLAVVARVMSRAKFLLLLTSVCRRILNRLTKSSYNLKMSGKKQLSKKLTQERGGFQSRMVTSFSGLRITSTFKTLQEFKNRLIQRIRRLMEFFQSMLKTLKSFFTGILLIDLSRRRL